MKTININKELNIKPINTFEEYLNPEFIYVPINDIKCLKCQKNTSILKGDIIYHENDNTIYSSISGIVKDVVEVKKCKFLLIQNDFKESTINNGKSRRIKNMNKDAFLSLLDSHLKNKLNKDINHLYINCLDIDPFVFNKYAYLKEEIKDILEFLKNMANILGINKVFLVVTDQDQDIITKYTIPILETGVVAYKIVNNVYPLGYDNLLAKHLIRHHKDELINLSELREMIYLLKKNRPITEKYITINGNAAPHKMIIKVKKYSLVSDILKHTNNYIENVSYIKNNSLYGKKINVSMSIIDNTFDGIIINQNEKIKELRCNNCGLCYNVCPSKINPLVKNSKCIKCGLCNYVCPHKINVVERYQK